MNNTMKLVERLRRVKSPGYIRHTPTNTFTSNAVYENPDGPEAADALEASARRVKCLEEALQRVINHPLTHVDGSMEELARTTLANQGGEK